MQITTMEALVNLEEDMLEKITEVKRLMVDGMKSVISMDDTEFMAPMQVALKNLKAASENPATR